MCDLTVVSHTEYFSYVTNVFAEECVHLQCLYKICFMENMLPKVLSSISIVKIVT